MVSRASFERAKRNYKRKNKQQSRSRAESSGSGSDYAPTYRVEENSKGELVHRNTGVVWPARIPHAKPYPDYPSSQSDGGEDQFASSPYEMIAIADLDKEAKAGGGGADGGGGASRSEQRVPRARRSRPRRVRRESSPQYVQLSGRSDYDEEEEEQDAADTDDSNARIDSVVFDTAEELARYQRVLAGMARQARSENEKSIATDTSDLHSVMGIPSERTETDRHYIGVRSQRAVEKMLTAGQFFIYYDKPSGVDIPVTIDLKIGYMSSTNKIYHFPIQRFECHGEPHYAVMQTDMDVKMFPTIAALVQHYHTFSHVDPETGRVETFGEPAI